MKKLMIAAAIVCAAVASQAAVSLQWSGTWITDQDGNDVESGAKAYLVDNLLYGGAKDALIAAVAAGKFDDTSSAIMHYGETDYSGGNGGYISLTKDAINSTTWAAEQAVDMYTVIINGDMIGISQYAAIGGDVLPADNNAYNAAFGELSEEDGTSHLNWYKVQTVPEPTSGLLLLLGVAGLALKRKRA